MTTQLSTYFNNHPQVVWLILVLAMWELVWKAVALWKAARNRQLGWFIAVWIINTVGILPILYVVFFQRDRSQS